jgi:hypothetical protein
MSKAVIMPRLYGGLSSAGGGGLDLEGCLLVLRKGMAIQFYAVYCLCAEEIQLG